LLEWRSSFAVRVRIARDYQQTYFDDKVMAEGPSVAGDPWQFRHAPSIQPMEAIKIRLTAVAQGVAATLNAGVDFNSNAIQMQSPLGLWSPVLQAQQIGAAGNNINLTVGCKLGTTRTIRTRDHQTWDPVTETWSLSNNNVGVAVIATDDSGSDPATAAQIEASITANSELIRVLTPHASPAAKVDMSAQTGQTLTGDLGATTAGADPNTSNAPTGEAAKLTGLALKIGIRPGLQRNLPASRTQ
jgi:hypothetical protein